jgi:two-component system, NarL family, response regulator LiaR
LTQLIERASLLAAAMRVLVLDNDRWREMGIARVLDRAPGLTPVLERDLGDQTWSKSLASVILVSDGSARTDARRSPRSLRRKFPHARILVHGELEDPAAIAEFLAQGADGYFTLSLGEEKLIKAISVIARGSVWLPNRAVNSIVEQLRSGETPSTLSAKEHALLRMLVDGLSNKEMASELGVAEITVKTRLSRLYRRFGVRTRVQLLSHAIRHGLVRHH